MESEFQVHELAKRWNITNLEVLRRAIKNEYGVYFLSDGLRKAKLYPHLSLGGIQPTAIDAYFDEQLLKLSSPEIRSLINGKPVTKCFFMHNLSKLELVQGDEPFKLMQIRAVTLDDDEKIIITLSEIEHLTVVLETIANVDMDAQESVDIQKRPGIKGDRDLDAAKWYKSQSQDIVQKMTTAQIQNALKTRNPSLWGVENAFTHWNREQTVWPKKTPGRKPRQVML